MPSPNTHVSSLLLRHPVVLSSFFFYCYGDHRDLHSFPTRRSSDQRRRLQRGLPDRARMAVLRRAEPLRAEDRKSTRLNSSHVSISYAVFCLKKKRKFLSNWHFFPLLKSGDQGSPS